MKILHILTFLSDAKRSFGGPASVALDLARAQAQNGHEVTVISLGDRPESHDFEVKTFRPSARVPRWGFAGMFSPRLLAWVTKNMSKYDLVHLHLARDLVTMPTGVLARITGVPYVVQPHGMIDTPTRRSAALLDRLATRSVLRSARGVLGLTESEEGELQSISGQELPFVTVGNGVSDFVTSRDVRADRLGPVVFVGRLQARKRPLLFLQAAAEAIARGVNNSFEVYGADEGERDGLERFLDETALRSHIRIVGSIPREEMLARLAKASVLVVTTDRERFGMAMLEAMAQGVPVICTDSADLAPVIQRAHAGLISDDNPTNIANLILALTNDPALWQEMSENATNLVHGRFTLQAVVRQIEGAYARAILE